MKIAVVDQYKCHPKQCSYECIKYCPRVRTGDEAITKSEYGKIIISETLCVGCGICIKKCYFNAINIIGLPESLNIPTQRYGKNGFALFGLPIPKKGQIIGILGSNGIGKSTALKIIFGTIIPNFGEEKSSKEKVLSNYSGTSLYDYFEKLYNNNIKLSQKPQYIDQIPKVFSGTVTDLFKVNNLNENKLEILIEKLNLKSILNQKINTLSGGELQRVAITICASKDADIYLFDEISSYLDIFQRIQVSKIIKDISKTKSVIVIEHDLALLDLLADTINIIYGKSSVYGIITLQKSTRVGINQYLDGYLKEENIRIRKDRIKFEEHPPKIDREMKGFFSYNSFNEKIGNFEISSDGGTLQKGEIIGIVGPNGIGKSTFIKMISGIIPTRSSIINNTYTISYKPQYIKPNENISVKDYLSRINPLIINTSYFEVEFEKPLELKDLYNSSILNLSGGELQRVAVTASLIKNADIYFIDEPSAHLDVEQRSNITKVIHRFTENNKKTTIIIDHDIYMIDMLSSRLIVLNGTPSVIGHATKPMNMKDGMNQFLKTLDITFRRDEDTKRPRINNYLSRLDRTQKKEGNYYYIYK